MPKSGSTFLTNIISELPDFRRAFLIPTSDARREQELDEFCLQQANGFSYVSQNHVRHSAWTADMCREYRVTPIVLVRNLLDVVVSLRDHMRDEDPSWPMFFADGRHVALDDAALDQMIARLAMPWYVNFYMGWRQAPDRLMVSYEELIKAPTRVVGEILAYAGARVSAKDIEQAVGRVHGIPESRFNVGVIGRGTALRPETVRAILDLIDFYPEATGDPYIQAVRAQARAALSGCPPPAAGPTRSVPTSRGPSTSHPWLSTKAKLTLIRRVLPLGLVSLAVRYWLWPNDLVSDSRSIGYVDDALILLVVAFMAGRLSRYKANRRRPRQRLRRPIYGGIQSQPSYRR